MSITSSTTTTPTAHPRGDDVLRELSTILAASLRASDIVARVGGEEFVVVLLDAELPTAKAAAERCATPCRARVRVRQGSSPLDG